jgi:ribosomal protein S18 acetylase RimI-like enzyme
MVLKVGTKSNYFIFKSTTEDIPKIRTLQAKIWTDTYPNKSAGIEKKWIDHIVSKWLTPESLENSINFLAPIFTSPDHYHCVAKINDSVCGFMHASKPGSQQLLGAIYVDMQYQGSGMAQKLMDSAMDWFDKTKDIKLEVADYNNRAISFYKKYGFELVKNSKHMFEDKIPTVYMIRKGDK